MAENVVFTGEGRPEVVKPRLVDKVLERVTNRLKQNTDQIVEEKYMHAYQRVVDALDEGKIKKVVQKIRPIVKFGSKMYRGAAVISDLVLLGGGMLDVGYGYQGVKQPEERIKYAKNFQKSAWKQPWLLLSLPSSYAAQQYKFANYTPEQAKVASAKEIGRGVFEFGLGMARISHVAAGWFADIAGEGGERVAQIANKIFSGKPKVEPLAA